MKSIRWNLIALFSFILLLFPASSFAEPTTGLIAALREDGSGFIYAQEAGKISSLSCTSCPDGAGGLFIRTSFPNAKIGQLYHLTAERQLVLLQENDTYYGNEGEQYVWNIFLWNGQLAGMDPYSKTIKIHNGKTWETVVDIDLSLLPLAQEDNDFYINGIAARAIDNKLYFTAFSYCDTILELDLKTGIIKPLSTQKGLQAMIMVDEDSFYYADEKQNVYRWDTFSHMETFCFTAPTEKVCAFQDDKFLGYTQAEASVWTASLSESVMFSTRLPISEVNSSLIWLNMLDGETLLFENAWLFEILPMKEEYVKDKIYEVYVDNNFPEIEAYIQETLDNPTIGYAMLRAFSDDPLYRPKLIYEDGNQQSNVQSAFYSDLDLHSSDDALYGTLTMRQMDENLRVLCGAMGLTSDWEWTVSDYDDINGCYIYQTHIENATILVEMLEKDVDQEIAQFTVRQRLTYEEGSKGFEPLFVCCYLSLRGTIDHEEWIAIEPYFENQTMVSPSAAEYFIANKDAFSYILWAENDHFEYEVYAIGPTIEAVFKLMII